MLLEGKTAILTGGAGGIGSVVAEEILKEGAKLCIVERDAQKLARLESELALRFPERIKGISGDITNQEFTKLCVQKTAEAFGAVDILINAAGIQGEIGPLWENDIKKWEEGIKVNLLGTFLMMHAAIPQMIKQGSGKIINFSGGGATGSRPFFSSYAASKTAVVRLTETVADELKEKNINIQVNAVAPGAINTSFLNDIIKAGPEKAGKEYELIREIQAKGGADPKMVAGLIVFLSSSLSDKLTGRLVSAIYDTWQEIQKHLDEIGGSDIYTLRRITPKDRGINWK